MKRGVVVLLSLGLVVSLEAQTRRRVATPVLEEPTPVVQQTNAGAPLAGATAAELAAFNQGRNEFDRARNVQTGLGPVFNDNSCRVCHSVPASGGGSNRNVTRFGTLVNGTFDPLTGSGGSLLQDRAIPGFQPERVPQGATIQARRRTTPLFGLGLVDATTDSDFIALAAFQASRDASTAGRVHMVDNVSAGMKTVGKFGWKAQQPTLFQFSGDAALNEMGITSPQFSTEVCPQGNCALLSANPAPGLNDNGTAIQALRDFMTLLGPPPRGAQNADTAAGETTFEAIGCGTCHVATLRTGASTVAALNRQFYHPYSDFLLHDMGSLGDGIVQGDATGNDIRTAPLWGLRFINRFLHDGRAVTIEEAIVAHEGQGRASRDRFQALPAADREKVLAFLRSL